MQRTHIVWVTVDSRPGIAQESTTWSE